MAAISPIPPGYHSITPFLMLNDLQGFLEFLRQAFDAQVTRQLTTTDGTVNHAEVRMGDSHIMIGDPMGQHATRPGTIYFYVNKVDAVYQQALEAGAVSISGPNDMFYGDRTAGVQDKWGNIWWIATHIEDVNEGELERRHAREMERRMAAQRT
jgi:PhnB protein